MDKDTIQAIAQLPTIAILIYLLVKAQGQNDKLLAGLIESERNTLEIWWTLFVRVRLFQA